MNDKDKKNEKVLENKSKDNKKSLKQYKPKHLTGEDIDMLRENNYNKKMRNICDYHQDGA